VFESNSGAGDENDCLADFGHRPDKSAAASMQATVGAGATPRQRRASATKISSTCAGAAATTREDQGGTQESEPMQSPGFKTNEEQAWFDGEPACEAPSDGRPGRKPPVFYIAVAFSAVSIVALGIMATIVLSSDPAQAHQATPAAAPAALVVEAENVGAGSAPAHIAAPAVEPAPAVIGPAPAVNEPAPIVIEPSEVAEAPPPSAHPASASSTKSSAAAPAHKRVRTARPGATSVRSAKTARPEPAPTARPVAPAEPAHRYGHF
jgi:hypothetical protein